MNQLYGYLRQVCSQKKGCKKYMPTREQAKDALDKVIGKARVHFYKPIQIAEILHNHRIKTVSFDPADLTTYRNMSRKWRDEVSYRLVGSVSTSSMRYQDDVFNDSAVPPVLLKELIAINEQTKGGVEVYIYKQMEAKLVAIHGIGEYISSSSAESFSLDELVKKFSSKSGLLRSMDKIYEIITFALFSSIVRELQVQVTVEILNNDHEILVDFRDFIKTVIGLDKTNPRLVSAASLYRVGATNAADAGLDMWANFGPAFQVKHLSLSAELVEEISGGLVVDKLIIVCKDGDKDTIQSILTQLSLKEKIQGIITFSDLKQWYGLCMGVKYRDKLGSQLLMDLALEFNNEFPTSKNMPAF